MTDIEYIDEDRQVIEFSYPFNCKITGSRISAILGMNKYSSEFKVACEIAGIYREPPNKYTMAGDAIEPVIRDYIRNNSARYLSDSFPGSIDIVDPVDKFACRFEHFPDAKPFGGLVDGWVDENGKHAAILEIKTASKKSDWFGENGEEIVPVNYLLQASLYCDLSGLKKIVFVVGFLEENDYEDPSLWIPTEDNTAVRIVDPVPMEEHKEKALAWFNRYIARGVTPKWTEDDLPLLDKILETRF